MQRRRTGTSRLRQEQKSTMAQVTSFEELSLEGLRDIYDAEQKALNAYPEMINAASSPDLKAAFEMHRGQTEQQITRLEQIFQKMNAEPQGKECKAADGLLAEAREKIQQVEHGPLLDAALIAAAQKVEHYEISAYGTARTLAQRMGDDEAAQLLQATLEEEELTDKKLTSIAESNVNQQAASQ